MELRVNRTRLLIGLASVAVAFAMVGIAVAPRSQSRIVEPAAAPTGSCADLAREVDPAKDRVDTGYDPERDLVLAEHKGKTYAMSPNDPLCRALEPARAVIDGMMSAHRENMAVACKGMRDLAASDRTEHRGRRVDKDAAQKFISKNCADRQR